jgi:uncharacterized protein
MNPIESTSLQLGQMNRLRVVEIVDRGAYLDGGDDGQVLLPIRNVPEDCKRGDSLDVFVYRDSEDLLIATTETPKAMVGDIASLMVHSVQEVGAFLDWGLQKHLFLPYAEQSHHVRPGQKVVVYLYLDNTDRIASSMRISQIIDKDTSGFKEGQEVKLLITGETDLGWKAVVNGRCYGVLYANEIFQRLYEGQELPGFIKKVRDDGKLDLSLSRLGHQAGEDIAPLILEKLKDNNGYLEINDKTSPELIYEWFGVSKKKYKIALGGLYKKRLITVEDDGIRLV